MNDDCEDLSESNTFLSPEEAIQDGLRPGWYYFRQGDYIGPFSDYPTCVMAHHNDEPAKHQEDGWVS
jgi:hypothetical protein